MRRLLPTLALLALLALTATALHAQSLPAEARAYLGDWTTYGDDGDEAQAVIRLTEENGVLNGRIVRVLPTRQYPNPQFQCDDCRGRSQGADLRTVPLIEDMTWDEDEFNGGRILDPQNGRSYRAFMRRDGPDRLRVRGVVGVRALGRTQVWRRAR